MCSRWEEPFGRTSLESSSCGCAVIITNRGGLPETITNGIIIDNLSIKSVYDSIESLILNSKKRKKLQKLSFQNFALTNTNASLLIDNYRNKLLDDNKNFL